MFRSRIKIGEDCISILAKDLEYAILVKMVPKLAYRKEKGEKKSKGFL